MLKIEHLKKTFSGKTILDDISLEVKSGEIVSIIGPSGTGKTTLLRCVNFLEKPDRGTITIDEVTADAEHSDGKTIHRLVQKSGMIFQSYNLFHNKTVLENVMEAQIIVKKRSRKEAEEIALEKLKENEVDIIVTDVMMPVMDGLTAAKTIRAASRADAKTIPIIAMTANAFAEDIQMAKNAGMNGHIAKPLDGEKMITVLKQCLADNSDVKIQEDL